MGSLSAPVDYSVADGVARLVLNTPENYNAMTAPMAEAIEESLEAANSDDEVRVLVITGVGPVFSAGGDVKEDLPKFTATPYFLADRSPRAGGHRSFVFQLQNFEKPTIAALNGVAAGGGFSLALACDLRIASADARLAPIFSRIGLAPDTGTSYLLPRLVGLAKALEISFTGDVIDAATALQIGLVNRVVPAEDFDRATYELAQKIAVGPPLALKLTKRLLYHGSEADLGAAYDLEGFLQGICLQSADFQEGIAAFSEKRQPRFTGK
jgi:2-(1,2-epoxy-1,2-dihydrophenyl)acetyl-CoA isomerase